MLNSGLQGPKIGKNDPPKSFFSIRSWGFQYMDPQNHLQDLQDHLQDLQDHLQDLQEHLQDLFQGGFKGF